MKICCSVVFVLANIFFCLTTSQAETSFAVPITTQTSLETPHTVCLGEPIIVHTRAFSTINTPVALLLGTELMTSYPVKNQTDYTPTWFKVSVLDSRGEPVKEKPDPANPFPFQGFTGTRIQEIDPSVSVDESVAVTSRFVINQAGKYMLHIHVCLPYAQVSDYKSEKSSLTASHANCVIGDVSFPITITQSDPEKLRSTAETICSTLQQSSIQPGLLSPSDEQALADSLFAMPEAEAAASWLNLIRHNRGILAMNQILAETRLVYLRTEKSADLLAYMAWELPPSNANTAQLPQYYLEQMYNTSDEPLRKHIRHLFELHGMADLPDKFPTFSPAN